MTTIVIFKLLAAPLLILAVTFLVRRFGPAVGGLLMGLPLTTGPISIFTAIDHGPGFAREAAIANIIGQISGCLFCLFYARTAMHRGSGISTLSGVAGYAAATVIWSAFDWTLIGAILVFATANIVVLRVFPAVPACAPHRTAPSWELPLRMIVATAFIMLITAASAHLSPQIGGLIAPFPVFVLILTVFTHIRDGSAAAATLTRSVIAGSPAFGVFFVIVAFGMERFPLPLLYSSATIASIAVGSGIYWTMRRDRHMPFVRHAVVKCPPEI